MHHHTSFVLLNSLVIGAVCAVLICVIGNKLRKNKFRESSPAELPYIIYNRES